MNIGEINPHIVGRVIKEAVRRATVAIRNERLSFEAHSKMSYGGDMSDVCTSADRAAQEIYLRTIQECFPNCGIIAEEDNLAISSKNGCTAYFTIDPLDGTRAFIRRQSHGVGSMIALVDNNQVLLSYIADVNTNEIYGYRPDSRHVFRITELDTFEELVFNSSVQDGNRYILLRDPPVHQGKQLYSDLSCQTIDTFNNYLVDGGSIGIWFARLWKREIAAALLPPSFETPWDSTPVIGICQKLGYKFFREQSGSWIEFSMPLLCYPEKRSYDVLVLHSNDTGFLSNKGLLR